MSTAILATTVLLQSLCGGSGSVNFLLGEFKATFEIAMEATMTQQPTHSVHFRMWTPSKLAAYVLRSSGIQCT